MGSDVSSELIQWYMTNKRDLPWRKTTDAYHIWVSEIILQQTRIAQGLAYYERFIEAFPTIKLLADAPQEKILKLWQGLGYYSRARNMHIAAKQIVENHNSAFPNTYKELLSLKGVGEYTAAAVASLAYMEPVPVIDGNVIRVISRLFAIQEPVDKSATLKLIKTLASEILTINNPSTHNQAMMEFGALHCTPANPGCTICPVNHRCLSFRQRIVEKIPLKSLKIKVRSRYLNYLVIKANSGFYFQKRIAGDIWEGLYEFPLIESSEPLSSTTVILEINNKLGESNSNFNITHISAPVKHILTHQKLHVCFINMTTKNLLTNIPDTWVWVSSDRIHELAIPRVIERYLNSSSFNL